MTTTDHNTDAEYLALMRGILETPADDAPRLIIADWLEENGEDQRAEFIRVQCELARHIKEFESACDTHGRYYHMPDSYRMDLYRKIGLLCGPHVDGQWGDNYWKWFLEDFPGPTNLPHRPVVTRGFVSEVRLTCAEFCGRPCENCRDGQEYVLAGPESHWDKCASCSGTGRIEGVARALFERHPILAVRFVDKRPYHRRIWYSESAGMTHPIDIASDLPDELFELVAVPDFKRYVMFDTEAAALAALSEACVSYGRALAGLPVLEAKR
jgi:uncharacterized protein (TIGR02996 family)